MDMVQDFGTEKVSKILLRIAPPIMFAQLIQALYNIVDSLFVGKYAESGLTALSIMYPIQLLIVALAVGLGVGINTIMAAKMGIDKREEADEYAGVGTPLILGVWLIYALLGWLLMPFYARISTESLEVIEAVVTYGRITSVFSIGLFLESVWTKILQAEGDMRTPMIAQILGALTNIVLDPILIFGMFGLPDMGIAGAAIATVLGQVVAAIVVAKKGFRKSPSISLYAHHIKKIVILGIPNILMQSAYTFYIFGLNMVLAGFSDEAVTALGIFYKIETFFFIPLGAMQTCIVPVISYNYAARQIERCKATVKSAIIFGLAFMAIGAFFFVLIPGPMLGMFTSDPTVIQIGVHGFRINGWSLFPLVTSLIFPVFFQAVGSGVKSSMLTIIRTLVLFVPLGFLFSRFGLDYFWFTYPVSEILTSIIGVVSYKKFMRHPYAVEVSGEPEMETVIKPSHPGVIITIAREHGSSGKQIGKLVAEKLNIPFYYKEMTALAAKESGLDKEFISDLNRNSPDILYDLYVSKQSVQQAVAAQFKIIKKIAEQGSCVIVGRASDYVLKDMENLVRIFIYAPEEYKIKRVMEIYHDTKEEAEKGIRRSNHARAAYYENISGNQWGDRHCYDLMIDASCGVEESAELICQYLKIKQK